MTKLDAESPCPNCLGRAWTKQPNYDGQGLSGYLICEHCDLLLNPSTRKAYPPGIGVTEYDVVGDPGDADYGLSDKPTG